MRSNTRAKHDVQAILVQCESQVALGTLSEEAMANLRVWLTEAPYGAYVSSIAAMVAAAQWRSLDDQFYMAVPFGTGGRRGPRGVGPNRINRRTIAESALGLANWVVKNVPADRHAMVVACDTRIGSRSFSRLVAQVAVAAGLDVFLFIDPRPTPELSFAVRHLNAGCGVMVSASHNPPADNGFKAYGPDGGQVVPPRDSDIMAEVEAAAQGAIATAPFAGSVRQGRIRMIGPELDAAYQAELALVPVAGYRDARIAFTPLHGVGATAVLPALEAAGFTDVRTVPEQMVQSGLFATVAGHIPNPEFPGALKQVVALAREIDADLAIATDPDADRLGCFARTTRSGAPEWQFLNGNQLGALLCNHVLRELAAAGRLRPDAIVARTAVTTGMIDLIGQSYGVGVINNLLVGYKYVASVLGHLKEPERMVFACEESHGYLSRPHCRDKDAANAALLLAEAAAAARSRGTDLVSEMRDLYRLHGYFGDRLYNYMRPGKTGQEEIAEMLDRLRAAPPRSLAGYDVVRVTDREAHRTWTREDRRLRSVPPVVDPATGRVMTRLLPARDNLMIYELAGNGVLADAQVAVRPSGTEPKCKFYVSVRTAPPAGSSEQELESVMAAARAEARRIETAILKKVGLGRRGPLAGTR